MDLKCSSCGEKLVDGGIDWYCNNKNCQDTNIFNGIQLDDFVEWYTEYLSREPAIKYNIDTTEIQNFIKALHQDNTLTDEILVDIARGDFKIVKSNYECSHVFEIDGFQYERMDTIFLDETKTYLVVNEIFKLNDTLYSVKFSIIDGKIYYNEDDVVNFHGAINTLRKVSPRIVYDVID